MQLKGLLEKIDFQSAKLISLIRQLLDISKAEYGQLQYEKEAVELNEFLAEAIEMNRHILPQHELSLNLSDGASVNIDRLRMEQVLSNLLVNAGKYSAKNTRIDVHCQKGTDGMITVAVRDEGIGLSKESIASVFDKFYRDKGVVETHSGLGMGLYITSRIVTDHGGKIWVESEVGKGSTFFFSLPYQE